MEPQRPNGHLGAKNKTVPPYQQGEGERGSISYLFEVNCPCTLKLVMSLPEIQQSIALWTKVLDSFKRDIASVLN